MPDLAVVGPPKSPGRRAHHGADPLAHPPPGLSYPYPLPDYHSGASHHPSIHPSSHLCRAAELPAHRHADLTPILSMHAPRPLGDTAAVTKGGNAGGGGGGTCMHARDIRAYMPRSLGLG